MRTTHDIIQRVRAEYIEMPGLQLTAEQLQRLCGIERTVCALVLQSLLDERFLWRKSDGQYARLTDGRGPRPRPATANLRMTNLLKAS
jgi:hypothetical protein